MQLIVRLDSDVVHASVQLCAGRWGALERDDQPPHPICSVGRPLGPRREQRPLLQRTRVCPQFRFDR
jgi:hypothetical protein